MPDEGKSDDQLHDVVEWGDNPGASWFLVPNPKGNIEEHEGNYRHVGKQRLMKKVEKPVADGSFDPGASWFLMPDPKGNIEEHEGNYRHVGKQRLMKKVGEPVADGSFKVELVD